MSATLQERWIQGLVAVQILVFALALLTRKSVAIQTCIFGLASKWCSLQSIAARAISARCALQLYRGLCVSFAAGIVFMGERLNKLGHKHWRDFSGQNYFDPSGVFFGVMVSGPLILTLFVILVSLTCIAMPLQAAAATAARIGLIVCLRNGLHAPQINYLRTCTQLLIRAKRAELKHRARQRAREQGASSEAKKDK